MMSGGGGGEGLKLFGVRIMGGRGFGGEEVLRKSASMGNLASLCESGIGGGAADGGGDQGYLSEGGSRPRRGGHDRKRGVPWTEEEHGTFLTGLKKLGKGDWRGISKEFVPTRTPTQVASHAQKYFLRKKRRSSLFDVVPSESVGSSSSGAVHVVEHPANVYQALTVEANSGYSACQYHGRKFWPHPRIQYH